MVENVDLSCIGFVGFDLTGTEFAHGLEELFESFRFEGVGSCKYLIG
jgi:hypothetical protein